MVLTSMVPSVAAMLSSVPFRMTTVAVPVGAPVFFSISDTRVITFPIIAEPASNCSPALVFGAADVPPKSQ